MPQIWVLILALGGKRSFVVCSQKQGISPQIVPCSHKQDQQKRKEMKRRSCTIFSMERKLQTTPRKLKLQMPSRLTGQLWALSALRSRLLETSSSSHGNVFMFSPNYALIKGKEFSQTTIPMSMLPKNREWRLIPPRCFNFA